MRLLWIALVLAACGSSVLRMPSDGTRWLELTSAHFTLWTDAPEATATKIIDELESHRVTVAHALDNAPATTRIYVVALDGPREAHQFMSRRALAVTATVDNPTLQPLILVDANDDGYYGEVFIHELTHAITQGIIRHQPRWLGEAMAMYFERALPHDGKVDVGLPREDRLQWLKWKGPADTTDVFGCTQGCNLDSLYATSWALFAFLVSQHFDELTHYLRRLDELPLASAPQAWREAFPTLPVGPTLDAALRDWLAHGSLPILHYPVVTVQTHAQVRTLADPDVDAIFAALFWSFARDKPNATSNATAALAADSTSVLASLVRHAVDHLAITPDAARALASAHPTDWRVWWLLARVAPGDAGRDAHDMMCSTAAADPSAAIDPQLCAAH